MVRFQSRNQVWNLSEVNFCVLEIYPKLDALKMKLLHTRFLNIHFYINTTTVIWPVGSIKWSFWSFETNKPTPVLAYSVS